MAITLAQAEQKVQSILDAIDRTLLMESYSIEQQEVKRTNLRTLEESLEKWEARVSKLSTNRKSITIKQVVPRG